MPGKISLAWKPLTTELNQLFSRLEKLDNHTLNKSFEENKWSILQHLEHLYLSEAASLAYINKKKLFPETLEEVGAKGEQAIAAIKMYFNNPNPEMGIKAPDWVTPKQEVYELKEVSTRWKKLREEMQNTMLELGEEQMKMDLYRHPFAGKMNLYHALQFIELHFKHHLKAIDKIFEAFEA